MLRERNNEVIKVRMGILPLNMIVSLIENDDSQSQSCAIKPHGLPKPRKRTQRWRVQDPLHIRHQQVRVDSGQLKYCHKGQVSFYKLGFSPVLRSLHWIFNSRGGSSTSPTLRNVGSWPPKADPVKFQIELERNSMWVYWPTWHVKFRKQKASGYCYWNRSVGRWAIEVTTENFHKTKRVRGWAHNHYKRYTAYFS